MGREWEIQHSVQNSLKPFRDYLFENISFPVQDKIIHKLYDSVGSQVTGQVASRIVRKLWNKPI